MESSCPPDFDTLERLDICASGRGKGGSQRPPRSPRRPSPRERPLMPRSTAGLSLRLLTLTTDINPCQCISVDRVLTQTKKDIQREKNDTRMNSKIKTLYDDNKNHSNASTNRII